MDIVTAMDGAVVVPGIIRYERIEISLVVSFHNPTT
jgi:hypothetical protein